MEDSDEITRAWMKFAQGRFHARLIAPTANPERIAWAIRNQRSIAGKTVMDVKEDAATICEAAVAFLARNTLGRHESAARERSTKDRFGPLLNLPVGEFVDYVQRELITNGYTEGLPVLEDFTQTKWKRYWETANLFHEDVIRYLLRPEVQLASLRSASSSLFAYPQHAVKRADGSHVMPIDDFSTRIGIAAVNATATMLGDPLRIVGLMVQMSLSYQPAVIEASEIIAAELYKMWMESIIDIERRCHPERFESSRDSSKLENKIRHASWERLIDGLTKLVDGYVVNNALYGHTKPRNVPTAFQQPSDIFISASMMAVGYEAIMNEPSLAQEPPHDDGRKQFLAALKEASAADALDQPWSPPGYLTSEGAFDDWT